jgi:hypothetical protein
MADMRTIATAWEARATDVNKYSAAGAFLPSVTMANNVMDTILAPTYIKSMVANDGWGTPWAFSVDGTGQTYAIISYGRDKVAGTAPTATTTTTNFDCDLVYSQGQFLQYPEGIQQQ